MNLKIKAYNIYDYKDKDLDKNYINIILSESQIKKLKENAKDLPLGTYIRKILIRQSDLSIKKSK